MTEAEWLSCNDLDCLLTYLRDRVSARKFRLFAVACCRRVWDLLRPPSRPAVELLERVADGLAEEHELEEALKDFELVLARNGRVGPAWYALQRGRPDTAWSAALDAARAARSLRALDTPTGQSAVFERQVPLLRCIFGNPFRTPALDPSWLTHGGGAAVALARSIDEDRRWSDLPFLGDVLEEAGCTDEGVLTHCRDPGEHARGCWLVDLVLRRE
ncbi:MAG: hypothetical protein L0Z62_27270 [Gemmataceae bacterium]|nr:hypothetical protein [Gemmataceae bacterium]